MKSLNFNTRLIDGYLELLRNLSDASKRSLIAKLNKSLGKKNKRKDNSFERSFGSWVGDESADELIESIRSSRTFNRKIEKL